MTYYDQGDLVRCSGSFTNSSGSAADPTTVTFKMVGANVTLTYVYGTDSQLVKDSTGNYHVDVTIGTTGATSAGTYTYRFEGTGAVVAAVEEQFIVRNSGIYG